MTTQQQIRNMEAQHPDAPPSTLHAELVAKADAWQDIAAESWGETTEHATLQKCADELRAIIAKHFGSLPEKGK